jgi:hypothetical protein
MHKLKIKMFSAHRAAMKLLAVATLACGILAGVQAVADGGSAKDAAAVAVTMVAIMSVGLAPGVHAARFGLVDRVGFVKELRARAKLMQPTTAARIDRTLAKMEATISDPEKDKANGEKIQALYKKWREEGDKSAKAELAQLRIVSIDNFIVAKTNPMMFFDTVSLANNEIPYIENTSKQEISVSYLGQDGRAKKTQGLRYQEQAQVDLHVLSTEEYEYTLMDIYRGEIKGAMLANVDMTRDFDLQVAKLMWPFVFKTIGNFNLTGPRSGRVFVPHSIVNTKNLPTTNLLVTPGNTDTSLFRKESMDVVLKYCAAFGDIFGAQLKPVAVFIPSSEVMGFLDQVTLTSQPNSKVEQIFDTGFVLDYAGVHWTFIADATLDPDPGLAYIKFNNAVGTFFTKPGMDKVFEDESIELQKQNKGSVSMSKVVGFGLPITARVNAAAVRYHNAR